MNGASSSFEHGRTENDVNLENDVLDRSRCPPLARIMEIEEEDDNEEEEDPIAIPTQIDFQWYFRGNLPR